MSNQFLEHVCFFRTLAKKLANPFITGFNSKSSSFGGQWFEWSWNLLKSLNLGKYMEVLNKLKKSFFFCGSFYWIKISVVCSSRKLQSLKVKVKFFSFLVRPSIWTGLAIFLFFATDDNSCQLMCNGFLFCCVSVNYCY